MAQKPYHQAYVTPAPASVKHGHVRFTQVSEAWPPNPTRSTIELDVRRVENSDRGEEVQISVIISEVKGASKRLYQTYGSMELTPALAEKLIAAIKELA